MSERILILGGAGFIGSKLTQKLLQNGHSVAIMDTFSQYSSPLEVNYSEAIKYRKKLIDGAKIYIADATISYDLERVCKEFCPNRIVHLAALTRADINDANMTTALARSAQPILGIMEIYKDSPDKLKRFLYVSSSYVYGNFKYSPCDEEHPKEPTSTYGGVKYACEVLTGAWARRYSIPYTIVRPIAAFGPSDLNGKLSMQNIKRAIDSKELYLMGELDELSDYTFVDDLAEGMMAALFSDNAINDVFNLSSGKGVPVSELLNLYNSKGFPVKPVLAEKLKSRPKRGFLSITKAHEAFGYVPKTSLSQGLDKCIDYIQKHTVKIDA